MDWTEEQQKEIDKIVGQRTEEIRKARDTATAERDEALKQVKAAEGQGAKIKELQAQVTQHEKRWEQAEALREAQISDPDARTVAAAMHAQHGGDTPFGDWLKAQGEAKWLRGFRADAPSAPNAPPTPPAASAAAASPAASPASPAASATAAPNARASLGLAARAAAPAAATSPAAPAPAQTAAPALVAEPAPQAPGQGGARPSPPAAPGYVPGSIASSKDTSAVRKELGLPPRSQRA